MSISSYNIANLPLTNLGRPTAICQPKRWRDSFNFKHSKRLFESILSTITVYVYIHHVTLAPDNARVAIQVKRAPYKIT